MATEKRLIDANAIPWEEYYVPDPDRNAQWDFKKEKSVLKQEIDRMPTVDAVEVIQCKDCKHYDKDAMWCNINSAQFAETHYNWYEEDFCSYGERK